MVVESGVDRGQGFTRFAASPRSGTMLRSGLSAGERAPLPRSALVGAETDRTAPLTPTAPQGQPKAASARRSGGGGGGRSFHGAFQPDPEVRLAKDARAAILELRTTLQTLKKEEQHSWRKKSQLMRDQRFETNAKKKHWATSDLSAALGEDALALGEDLKNQREEMYTLGQQLRREARVPRKPPLPNFRQDHSYTRELEHQVWVTSDTPALGSTSTTATGVLFGDLGSTGASSVFDGALNDTRPIPMSVHAEEERPPPPQPQPPPVALPPPQLPELLDPRTAAILARVEPESLPQQLEPEPEPEPEPDLEKERSWVWDFSPDREDERDEEEAAEAEQFAEELQRHFVPPQGRREPKPPAAAAPSPPMNSRVEYFRQLDAKARLEKAAAAQREEEARVATMVAARQALIDLELGRRGQFAERAAKEVVAAVVRDTLDADAAMAAAKAALAAEAAAAAAAAAAAVAAADATAMKASAPRISSSDEQEQEAATRAAERLLVLAAESGGGGGGGGGGEAGGSEGSSEGSEEAQGLRRRVAQRWLLKEFIRCTRMYR